MCGNFNFYFLVFFLVLVWFFSSTKYGGIVPLVKVLLLAKNMLFSAVNFSMVLS